MGRVVLCASDITPLWLHAIQQEKSNKIIGLSLISLAASSFVMLKMIAELKKDVKKLKEANKCNA